MRKNISRALMLAILTLLFGTSGIIFSTKQSYADVGFKEDKDIIDIYIFNTISKTDANYIAQRATNLEYKVTVVTLNSVGGNVDAAMQIGRIIRKSEAHVIVSDNMKCFSSCGLIYIAGVYRINGGV